jgi:cytochrome oxidase Cu insertion factor (SCO1/SenC/PrrC family)
MSKSLWLSLAIVLVVVLTAGNALSHSAHEHTPKKTTTPSQPSVEPPSSGSPWGADYFPNVELSTTDGQKLHFFDDLIKDKVVMLNFIYTSCVDSCPLETARLRQVQKLLGDRVGKDVFLYSITIDPEHDTPEVLAAYAKKFHAGPGWLFLYGSEPDVTQIRKKFGIYEPDQGVDQNLEDHIISLVIGNQKTGQWIKASAFDPPQLLATKVGSWLSNWKTASTVDRSYDKAPELRHLSRGESLFRTRCSACHTIGGGNSADIARGDIGPDLFGVAAKRDRAWLIRFLAEPDKMIEEKDPLALSLLQQYNGLAMPNLRLSEVDIAELIKFLVEESDRLMPAGHQPKTN